MSFLYFAFLGILVWFEAFTFAFWITVLAIANGVIGTAYAYMNPEWYEAKKVAAGAEPSIESYGPGPSLLLVKLVVTPIQILIAYWLFNESGQIFNS